ncbi:MAG: ferritin-like domain-containing protein [Gammaproteobacteria bacterium]|jgi:rubrerythrin|nr:ferritin-like domain-containing protein [Gammaproteobacteria bacterium]
MKSPLDVGGNRTGADASPELAKEMMEGATMSPVETGFDLTAMEAIRSLYSRGAEPFGTMPPPPSVKGKMKSGMQKLKGKSPAVFLDLIADRLAFERTGTRLYEALLVKYDASDAQPGGPTRDEILHIHDEELEHFGLLMECMKTLGADPTAISPTADADAVASTGVMQLLSDPRSTLTECLHAIHMVELVDNDAWEMLASLADRLGHDSMAEQFRHALSQENDHLRMVRSWLQNTIEGQVGIS